jgi:hypothetical protein
MHLEIFGSFHNFYFFGLHRSSREVSDMRMGGLSLDTDGEEDGPISS